MKGKLIVIEGTDGSGKETQSNLLYQYLSDRGIPCRIVHFPNYNSPSSSLVKMYLAGEFGTEADSVSPYIASIFYAGDRYASWKTDWMSFYEQGGHGEHFGAAADIRVVALKERLGKPV